MKKIAVLGAGIMGAGIAQVCAQAGFEVILRDLQISLVNDGMKTIADNLNKLVARGSLEAKEIPGILSHLHGTIVLAELKDVDLVIEAVVENVAVKRQIFAELDNICPVIRSWQPILHPYPSLRLLLPPGGPTRFWAYIFSIRFPISSWWN